MTYLFEILLKFDCKYKFYNEKTRFNQTICSINNF